MNPDISLHPLDMGFDIRLHDQPVILNPKISAVKYETQAEKPEDRQTKTASGSYHEILTELQANGFQHIVADQTPNGRYIQFATGKYVVQPENDNYSITCDTLDQAHDAYYQGQKIRYHDNDMPMYLHRRIKTAAAASGKHLKAWVREALEEKLSRQ